MGGEGATFATSHPELRDGDPQLQPWCCWQLWKGIFSHCSPLWQQSEVHCCSQRQWITQHKPSHISHTLNREIHSIFNYDNISSVLLIMNQHRLGSSALHSIQTVLLQGIPKDHTVGVWALMPGEYHTMLPCHCPGSYRQETVLGMSVSWYPIPEASM